MCIAILNKKGIISDYYLKNSWENNDQGGGILYVENEVLRKFKTYDFEKFIQKYKKIKIFNIQPIVLHFRIATSGFEPDVNLHPFFVNKNLGFVHNGILQGMGDYYFSDTYYFNQMLKIMPEDFLKNKSTKEKMSNFIGLNKLIFLDNKNKYTIINEKLGTWEDDNWYSNNSYRY